MKNDIIKIIHEVVVKRSCSCVIAEENAACVILKKINKDVDFIFITIDEMYEKLYKSDKLDSEGYAKAQKNLSELKTFTRNSLLY